MHQRQKIKIVHNPSEALAKEDMTKRDQERSKIMERMKPETNKPRPSVAELRKQTPQERQSYLHGMVETINRKYPEMDPGAQRSIAFFLTEITPIVRPSGNEAAMREYLVNWSETHAHNAEMRHAVDGAGNLLIEIAPTPGYEDVAGVILQSHMDMNCNPTAKQNPDISPEVNPVIPVFKDNETKVATEGHTLGADDGLGMATEIILAEELMESGKPHGKVALLFTTDEEVGLTGAEGFSFDKELLKGYNYYFNLDNEDTHEAVVGAAGGRNIDIRLPLQRDPQAGERTYIMLDLRGLTGGHSGADIHLGHLNAIKVMDQYLSSCAEKLDDMRLVHIAGGTTDSAIPQRAQAIVAIKPGEESLLQEVIAAVQEEILQQDQATKQALDTHPVVKEKEKRKGKLAPEEPVVTVSAIEEESELLPLTADATGSVIALLDALPTGPLEIDEQYTIVKTSTNMGILDTVTTADEDFLHVFSLTRSSSEESTKAVNQRIGEIAVAHGAQVEPGEKQFSAWEPDFNDPLLHVAKQTHKDATGKDLDVTVLHAGLESHTIRLKMKEILGDEMPEDFHIISLGPTLDGPHSESEYFDIQEAGEFFPAMRLLFQTVLQNEIDRRPQPPRRAA